MKLFIILLLGNIGMAYSANLNMNTQCSVCTATLDWARSNYNILSFMEADEQVPDKLMDLLKSVATSEDICGQLSMCDTNVATDFDDDDEIYWNVLRGGRGGGRGGRGRGGRGRRRRIKRPKLKHHDDCEKNKNC